MRRMRASLRPKSRTWHWSRRSSCRTTRKSGGQRDQRFAAHATARDDRGPAPFTVDDYAARIARAARSAERAGLAGLLVTPGPDLLPSPGMPLWRSRSGSRCWLWLPAANPTMIVPILERPDAEVAPSASRLQIVDWQDRTNPYEAAAKLLDPPGPYAISDSAW